MGRRQREALDLDRSRRGECCVAQSKAEIFSRVGVRERSPDYESRVRNRAMIAYGEMLT